MNWLPLALIPSALFAVSNYLDKYLLEKYFKFQGNGALIIFSSLIGIVAAPIVLLFDLSALSVAPLTALFITANGMLYVIALLPYLASMRDEETSVAVPLWQLIPVFGYLFGYLFLSETLTLGQIGAGLVVILGALLLSMDFDEARNTLKWRLFLLMSLSSALMALNGVLFKVFAIEVTYGATIFWDCIGLVVIGMLYLIFAPVARREFFEVFRVNGRGALTLNAINEVVNIIAMFILNYALLLAPVALIFLANAAQPLFVLVFGVALTLLVPHLVEERLGSKVLAQKLIAIALLGIGAFLMDYVS